MGNKRKEPYEHTATILNAYVQGRSYDEIAANTGCSTGTVTNVKNLYPLWEYYRQHPQE